MKLRVEPLATGGAALFDGKEHFITLETTAAANEIKSLVEAALASEAPAKQIVGAIALALNVSR
ncbi:hypothetical protein [Devosia sp. Leaf64]|uniref:hypothetical protein n=1 Tax=Devosia sp. Leaf64 TaxID=1736229 RepID=UPI000715F674|nr:hypothetical protein [Devosia sp. Leaf64]KQN75097.1 hypothetical protein ASE94_01900 [Devosia sp. Leaf64]